MRVLCMNILVAAVTFWSGIQFGDQQGSSGLGVNLVRSLSLKEQPEPKKTVEAVGGT